MTQITQMGKHAMNDCALPPIICGHLRDLRIALFFTSRFDVGIQTDDRRRSIQRLQVRQQSPANLGWRTRGVESQEVAGATELVSARGGILRKPQRLGEKWHRESSADAADTHR